MLHGGGYVFGSPKMKMYRGLAGRIAKAAGATVHAPDYRLAPEHPHPAAVDDGLAAYRLVLERVPATRLVVCGDSAGGGLTLAVISAARDSGLPLPAGLVLLSPWLDLRGRAADRPNASSEILIVPDSPDRNADWYRGDYQADNPAISPLLMNPNGLPPTLVQVSATELVYHETVEFVAKARDAGVEVTLEVEDDMWHDWHLMAPAVPEARAAIDRIGRFVAGRFLLAET